MEDTNRETTRTILGGHVIAVIIGIAALICFATDHISIGIILNGISFGVMMYFTNLSGWVQGHTEGCHDTWEILKPRLNIRIINETKLKAELSRKDKIIDELKRNKA